jgi:glyoxylase-like metal-dependent hydrolase (beta-lactamase superfamily II)
MPDLIRIGDIDIARIVESEGAPFEVKAFFPKLTDEMLAENRSWLEPRYIDPATQKLKMCFQSYIVRLGGKVILIDTCVGNHKARPARPFWHMQTSDTYMRRLAAQGLRVEDIDMVMCTHLHVDHVGWNTRLDNGRWVPTFPNARYVMADKELAFWTERARTHPETCPWIADSVLPVLDAKRADIVKSDFVLEKDLRFIPTPGHTIDHFSVHVGTEGYDAVITGDMIHSPIQARYPEIGMMSDYDSALAGKSRRELFGRFCDTPTLMCTAHFPSPSHGRVTRWGDGFRFVDI